MTTSHALRPTSSVPALTLILGLLLAGSVAAFQAQGREVELTNCPIDVHERTPARVVVGYDMATFDATTRKVTFPITVSVWGASPSSVKLQIGDHGAEHVIDLATDQVNQISIVVDLSSNGATIEIENDSEQAGLELSETNHFSGAFDRLLVETTISQDYVAHDVANKDRVRFTFQAYGLTTGFIMQEV